MFLVDDMLSKSSSKPAWAQGAHVTPYQVLQALLSWIYVVWANVWSVISTSRARVGETKLEAPPARPVLELIDARCNRAKLQIVTETNKNEEEFEFQLRYRLDNEGDMSLAEEESNEENWIVEAFRPGMPRNVVSLHEHSKYKARVRTRTQQGVIGEWGPLVKWQTLFMPVNGGTGMGAYKWGQNAAEVWVTVSIPASVKSKHVSVVLQPEYLKVTHTAQDKDSVVAVEGRLPWRVRLLSPEGGSHWEICRDSGTSTLTVVLEKEKPAGSLKWGLWRSMFAGEDEIDTHAMELDPHIAEILQSLHRQKGARIDRERELNESSTQQSG